MGNDRKPLSKRPSTRHALRLAWREATHVSQVVNVTDDRGETRSRTVWTRKDGTQSLRQFARSAQAGDDGVTWLWNKKANSSKPPLGLGRTRKRKGGDKGGSK